MPLSRRRQCDRRKALLIGILVVRLAGILDLAARQSADEELERLAVPLVTLLRRIHEFAPDNVRARLTVLLLPAEAERARPLGQADTLPGRLLRLSASPMAPKLRDYNLLDFEIKYGLLQVSVWACPCGRKKGGIRKNDPC